MILPQIPYRFRTLPIPVNSSSLAKKYIWNNKRALCSHAHLVKHKKRGGVGLVTIPDYWVAAQMSQLKKWFLPALDNLWVDSESYLLHTSDLKIILLADI